MGRKVNMHIVNFGAENMLCISFKDSCPNWMDFFLNQFWANFFSPPFALVVSVSTVGLGWI